MSAGLLLFASAQASAVTPADFVGVWIVKKVAGASNVVSAADPRNNLGTKLWWTKDTVRDAEGTCTFVTATVQPMTDEKLENFVWGGQTIAGLDLPVSGTKPVFGKHKATVFYDGGKGCIEAVMLSLNHVLFRFHYGYLYLLDRLGN